MSGARRTRWIGLLGVVPALLLATCATRPLGKKDVPPQSASAVDSKRVHALLVNGGGRASSNYQSHVIHLRGVLDVLSRAGVTKDQITVFAADGDDPQLDLAVRELPAEGDGWLLDGTRLQGSIGRPMEYVSTEIDGIPLRPATEQGLREWFASEGKGLGKGDVLFLYVTDHGNQGKDDPLETTITLWGNDESLTVRELQVLLAELDPDVRVVTLMSQCYSGGFAWLASDPSGTSLPSGRVCGYFATTEDRQAYGCYPENRGAENVGHSVRFLESLARDGRFESAHEHTLVNDHTPDVPLRTSDEQAWLLLDRAAKRENRDPVQLVDELLAQAWRDPGRFEAQIRLLDRIGRSYGFASPRSIAEIDQRLEQIPKVSDPVANHADAWQEALNDVAQANLNRFLIANPEWVKRVEAQQVKTLDTKSASQLGSELASDLGPSTRGDGRTYQRLTTLRERAETANDIAYRMDVREAVLLRMENILIDIAAQVYLDDRAPDDERRALAALQSCEDLRLNVSGAGDLPALEDHEPFPAWADDLELASDVLPAWMGIQFRQATEATRREHSLRAGAVSVQRVYPQSPAAAAGIEAGDVILGPPGDHFTEPRQVREWTMLAAIDEPRPLDVLHDGSVVRRTLVPGSHPGRFPELPAPPKVGDAAPPLRLSAYRDAPPASLADGSPHLLFFWATWCVPCKAALPELSAFARERNIPVIAISDEERPQLDAFFEKFTGEFPDTVTLDQGRATFLAYGVSGTPTFVLVDGKGVVQSTSTGYSPKKGLGIAGWHWAGAPQPKSSGG